MEEGKTARILRELPEELVGKRVIVRPYRPGDGAALFEAIDESREHLAPWMPWTKEHKTPDDSEAYARRSQARWLLREDLGVGLWERETGRYLGGSGLHRIQWDVPSFEIGYWIRASAEGKGYMTEAVRLLCRLAFDTLEANRVFIRCDSRNTRSAAIPRRLGFQHEATLRNDARSLSGELRDTFHFAMTPEDYARAREQSLL
ncbi:MAG TPA: GNAT family N-acetyltransferase [Chthonomonadaceae bacterium]|nr:GNAT family N-acetyltransferase [Chthonomonadaceae bacterium]